MDDSRYGRESKYFAAVRGEFPRLRIGLPVFSVVAVTFKLLGMWSAAATEDDAFAVFRAHDEESTTVIKYPVLNRLLVRTVYNVGLSHRWSPRARVQITGTRITRQNHKPSWLEGNRVLFDRLKAPQVRAIAAYRQILQKLPDRIDFAGLKRNEQLAYWLNLYNITVFEQIASRYPVVPMLSLRQGSADRPGLWDQKLLTVKGVPMSLNDIQNRILIPVWRSPLVLYGLFQGAVGGPSIRRHAFRGGTVHDKLEESAEEFVNSIRGVHRQGDVARASMLYRWGAAAFPDWETDLRRHLSAYADDQTRAILEATTTLVADYFDWSPADLYNGHPDNVRMLATCLGTCLMGAINTDFSSLDVLPEQFPPPHTAKFLLVLEDKFKLYGYPDTIITIEDIETDDTVGEASPKSPDLPD